MCVFLQEYVCLKNTVIIFIILSVVLNISGFLLFHVSNYFLSYLKLWYESRVYTTVRRQFCKIIVNQITI